MQIDYTNPCDTSSFFGAVSNPITRINHVPGLTTVWNVRLEEFIPDVVSNSHNVADQWTFCKDARQYSIT